jgi:hypothetical protein
MLVERHHLSVITIGSPAPAEEQEFFDFLIAKAEERNCTVAGTYLVALSKLMLCT